MFKRLTLAAFFSVCASTSWAAAQLQVPEHLEVLSINGQNTVGNLLSRARSYTLPNGDVVLEVRYADLVPADVGDSHSNYRSQPLAIRFAAEDQQHYVLRADRPQRESEARRFSKAPVIRVEHQGGKPAPQQQVVNDVDLKNSVLTALTKTAAPQVPVAAPAPAPVQNVEPAPASLAGQNLWYWWQQSDEATRRDFLKRIGR